MHTESRSFSIQNLFDESSEWKQNLQFYLISAAIITFILPPEYNNPFLVLIGLNSLINKLFRYSQKCSDFLENIQLSFL